jgi:hypothetical protein
MADLNSEIGCDGWEDFPRAYWLASFAAYQNSCSLKMLPRLAKGVHIQRAMLATAADGKI